MADFSQSKQKIYSAALSLFASRGYAGTSIGDIAAEVGIRKASVYSHFSGKDEIFTTILEEVVRKHQQKVLEILESCSMDSALETLEQYFFRYIRYCQGNEEVDFWTRVYYFPPEGFAERIHQLTHSYEEVVEEKLELIIENGIAKRQIVAGDARDIMLSYYYLLVGFVMSLNFYKDKDTTKDAVSCISVFINGIKS